jgi:competence protein ComEC
VSATQPAAAASADDDTIVYVTEHGKKYHRKDCAYVRNGSSALKLKDARARGCTPCSKCKPPR